MIGPRRACCLATKIRPKAGLNAKRGAMDTVFLVETKLLEKLPKEASDWRDRALMAFKRDERRARGDP